jgi:hypothetical protein
VVHTRGYTSLLDPRRSTRGDAGPSLPPVGHDGTEGRIGRPQDPTEQTRCDRGEKKCYTVKNVLLIKAALTILFLSDTYAGSTHMDNCWTVAGGAPAINCYALCYKRGGPPKHATTDLTRATIVMDQSPDPPA